MPLASNSSLKQKGNEGELLVINWLVSQGYTILHQNFLTKMGEVDIIAQQDDVIAFVEVKTRNTSYFDLSQVITYKKQQKIIKSAYQYLNHNQHLLRSYTYRFDVALVEYEHIGNPLTYIPDAFRDSSRHCY